MLNKLLNIKYPIIQGAMANIANAKFAAAVSNAGGLGILATGSMTLEMATLAVRECKELTNKPFGVNVMLMNPYSKEIMEMLAFEKVKVVTTGAGNPGPYIKMLKESGALVIPVVPSVGLARRMERANADAIIVEGTEAGGHVGELTTMALLPQVCDAVNIPVIAAGGIADGRGVAAAYALGAIGVQIGTVLLASEECPIHENYQNLVLKAKDIDTVVTGRSLNTPVRVLKNKMSREYIKMEETQVDRHEMEKLTLGSLRKAVVDGDLDNGSFMSGQIAGLVKEVKPLSKIFSDMMEEASNLSNNLNSLISYDKTN